MDPVDAAGVRHPQPDPELAVDVADAVEQLRELPVAVVPAVHAGVLSGDADLLRAGVDERPRLLDVFRDGRGVDAAGRELRDTVRAVAHTAAGDREETDHAVEDGLGVGRDGRALAVEHVRGDLVPVEDFGVDVGRFEHLALCERHTAGDDEVGGRLRQLLGAPEHVLFRLLDDRTGVEDGDIRVVGAVGRAVAAVAEGALYLPALTPVRTAAVGFDVIRRHRVCLLPVPRAKTRRIGGETGIR